MFYKIAEWLLCWCHFVIFGGLVSFSFSFLCCTSYMHALLTVLFLIHYRSSFLPWKLGKIFIPLWKGCLELEGITVLWLVCPWSACWCQLFVKHDKFILPPSGAKRRLLAIAVMVACCLLLNMVVTVLLSTLLSEWNESTNLWLRWCVEQNDLKLCICTNLHVICHQSTLTESWSTHDWNAYDLNTGQTVCKQEETVFTQSARWGDAC